MILKIISSTEIVFEGKVDSVTLPGQNGSFTVLNNHASLISTLVAGNVRYKHDGVEETAHIDGGIVDVDDNVVSVCVK